ncbi:MAG: 50S ribosomal protein L17 [Verrucomicrobia bacterium]|nr:50S ribosomal protein L17 [Verrucomicrobiota bacterium]
MRHLKRTAKLGRTGSHRNAMLANMACSLIKHKRIETTLAKAKVLRPVVEKLLTLGKRAQKAIAAAAAAGDDVAKAAAVAENVHCRRLLAARLRQHPRTNFKGTPTRPGKVLREKWRKNEDVVRIICDEIAPVFKERNGGYTRIIKLGQRIGDAAKLAIIEWVELPVEAAPVATGDKTAAAAK